MKSLLPPAEIKFTGNTEENTINTGLTCM